MTHRRVSVFALMLLVFTLALPSGKSFSQETQESRSPWLSLGLSLGSTLVFSSVGAIVWAYPGLHDEGTYAGLGLLLPGLLVGPSIGHFYVGEWERGLLMIGGRMAFTAMAFGSLQFLLPSDEYGSNKNEGAGLTMLGIGCIGIGSLLIWDIVDSPFAAKRFNESSKNKWSIGPMVLAPPLGNQDAGPASGLQFTAIF